MIIIIIIEEHEVYMLYHIIKISNSVSVSVDGRRKCHVFSIAFHTLSALIFLSKFINGMINKVLGMKI